MTDIQAFAIAAQEGRQIKHRFFSDDEYIEILSSGEIRTEEGYKVTLDDFWRDRHDEAWKTGWSVITN